MKIRSWIRLGVPPILPLIAVIVALEFIVRTGWVRSFILPPPTEVFESLVEDGPELLGAFYSTASAAFLGLILSFLLGGSAAVVLSMSGFLRRAFYPYAVFFQTVPIISIAPLLVIWFGYGHATVVASAFIVSVFPVIASTLLGLRSTDPALEDLFRLYSAGPFDRLFMLKLPSALPFVFSGLRISSGLAVIGAIVGEFIAGGGLGAVIDAARTQQRIEKVFAAVLVSSLLGLILVGFINLLSFILLRRWHASVQKS